MTMKLEYFTPDGMIGVWSLVDGFARCVEAPIAPNAPGATEALQRRDAIQAMIDAVEVLEAAQALVAAGEPDNGEPRQIADPAWTDPGDGSVAPLIGNPAWALAPREIATTDAEGQPQTIPDPRWLAFDAAQATIAAASPATVALAAWRAAEPQSADAGHSVMDDAAEAAGAPWQAAREAALAELEIRAARPLERDPRPVPAFVTMFQGRSVLRMTPDPRPGHAGTLLDAIDAFVAAQKPTNPALADAWEYAQGFERDGAFVAALHSVFGLSDRMVDDLFRAGALIHA